MRITVPTVCRFWRTIYGRAFVLLARSYGDFMDPLSDVLSLLRPRSYSSGGFDLGSEWSISFPKFQGVKCYAVVSGHCWLRVEGIPEALHLETGDCILLPAGRPFQLASDLAVPSVDIHTLLVGAKNGGVISWNGGGNCFLVAGYFALDGNHAEILLGTLPPVVHVRSNADAATLRWSLERMKQEVGAQRAGGLLITQHIAYTMLVEAIRLHLESGFAHGAGWLFALADKQLSAAMSAMHEDPAHRWTLQTLAERAGMSRTIFSSRFKEVVGSSVMDYLGRWRMLLAADRLRHTKDAVSEIALSLGYESESAFSKAFKRMMGCSPRQYARGCDSDSAPIRKRETSARNSLELVG
jgi:AraC-like DNA-binding protein